MKKAEVDAIRNRIELASPGPYRIGDGTEAFEQQWANNESNFKEEGEGDVLTTVDGKEKFLCSPVFERDLPLFSNCHQDISNLLDSLDAVMKLLRIINEFGLEEYATKVNMVNYLKEYFGDFT